MSVDIQPVIDGEEVAAPHIFHLSCFGNFSGGEEDRPDLSPRPVNRNTWDRLFEQLAPRITMTIALAKIPDIHTTLTFTSLKDFGERAIARQLPTLRAIDGLITRLKQSSPESPLSASQILAEEPATAQLKELAQAHGGGEVLDLLSMVDIGETSEFQLPRLADFFKTGSYTGTNFRKIEAELKGIRDKVIQQVRRHSTLNAMHGRWRGLQQFFKHIGPQVKLYIVDCHKGELCDATFLNYVKPEDGTAPPPLDLAIYAESFNLSEDDHHTLYYLGKMAESLKVPFLLDVEPVTLGLKTWPMLSHFRDMSSKLGGPTHIKWRKLREEPGSQWLYLWANPLLANDDSSTGEDAVALMPASVYAGMVMAYHLNQGDWPKDLVGPYGQLRIEASSVAQIEEDQANDLAYYGICAINSSPTSEHARILGMNCFGTIQLKDREKLDARNLVEYTLAYRFFAGCCSRFLEAQEHPEQAKQVLAQFAMVKQPEDIEYESLDDEMVYRIKAPFTIFGMQPDIVLFVA